jgi:hypothetical protein
MKTNVSFPHPDCPACRKVYGEGPYEADENQVLIMQFELYEPLYVGPVQKGTQDFEIIADSSDSNYIVGFRITIPDDDLQMKVAEEKAVNFVNYLSIKTRNNINCKRPNIIRIVRGKPFVTSWGTMQAVPKLHAFDLDISRLSGILAPSEPMLTKRLSSAKRAQAALIDHDWEEAFRLYYQVIEGSGGVHEKEFKPLRNAVSHAKLDDIATTSVLQNKFGMKVQAGEPVNFNDPDNLRHLEFHTYLLKAHADTYLNAELAKLNL